jgi:hypothetical protein
MITELIELGWGDEEFIQSSLENSRGEQLGCTIHDGDVNDDDAAYRQLQ